MSVTKKARRSDALYFDNSKMPRRTLCDMVAQLEEDKRELQTENAKLRELVDAWMGCGTRYHTMSGACPMFDANAKDCCKAEEIARELGVGVDDA